MQPSPLFISRTFSSLQTETLYPFANNSPFPSIPQPLVTSKLLPVSPSLPVPDISHEWNHRVCSLVCLAPFTWCNVFKVHLCCSSGQYSIHSCGQITVLHPVYPSIHWWTLELSHLFCAWLFRVPRVCFSFQIWRMFTSIRTRTLSWGHFRSGVVGEGEGEQLWVKVVDHGPLAHTCPCGHW